MIPFTPRIGKNRFRFVYFQNLGFFMKDFSIAPRMDDLLSSTMCFHFVHVMFAFEDDFGDELEVVVVVVGGCHFVDDGVCVGLD